MCLIPHQSSLANCSPYVSLTFHPQLMDTLPRPHQRLPPLGMPTGTFSYGSQGRSLKGMLALSPYWSTVSLHRPGSVLSQELPTLHTNLESFGGSVGREQQ